MDGGKSSQTFLGQDVQLSNLISGPTTTMTTMTTIAATAARMLTLGRLRFNFVSGLNLKLKGLVI